MLQTGLIGNTEKLKPFVKSLQRSTSFDVIGKASTGMPTSLGDFHYSMPEVNRIELIERADVLLIDDSLSGPFPLLADMVKKSKHIFIAGYVNLSTDECGQLVKLANESGSVVQVYNPFYYTPPVRWMSKNVPMPVFLELRDFSGSSEGQKELYPIVLMLLDITGINPKKVAVSAFRSVPGKSEFTNVRLEFGDASVVNLNYGSIATQQEFEIKSYSRNQFAHFNFTGSSFLSNNDSIDLTDLEAPDEFTSFANAIQRVGAAKSSIEDYLAALQLVQKINQKINQFVAE